MTEGTRSPLPLRRIAAALVLALALMQGGARAAPPDAADTVRAFYDALLQVMKNGPALGPKGRYAQLAPVIERTFDVPYMIRIVVGPTWSGAAEDRRKQATAAFARYIAATYADRFASYNGQQLEVTGAQPRGSDAIVDSRIVRAGGEPVMIRYVLHLLGADWRVIDVYLDGTISELATRHSEFASILQRGGIDGLIAALNQKSDMLVH